MKWMALALLLGASACASQPEAEPAPRYLQSTYSPPFAVIGEWSHLEGVGSGVPASGHHLTRHGFKLDRVWIISDLRPGQRLVEASAQSQDGPAWSGRDLKGLVEGSLWALGYGGVGWQGTAEATQGAWGPTAAFQTLTDRGLTYEGALRARLDGDALDLVIWVSEERLYAPLTKDDAFSMLNRLDQ